MPRKRGSTLKPRRVVYNEGKLKEAADLFIAALLHYRRETESTMHFMERLFNVDTRFVFQCVVTSSFALDGRPLKPGDRVLVRHDTTNPNEFEVADIRASEITHVVQRAQWRETKSFLRVVDKNRHGAERVFGV